MIAQLKITFGSKFKVMLVECVKLLAAQLMKYHCYFIKFYGKSIIKLKKYIFQKQVSKYITCIIMYLLKMLPFQTT